MKPLDEIYGSKFFARRHRLEWRCEIVCNAINNVLSPKSVIDVGCAIGDYVKYWRDDLNIEAWGIEGSVAVQPYLVSDYVYILDLREKITRLHADLVMCLEVFEHVESEHVDILIENITNMSDRLLVSAAPPGAGGVHHVNCQPKKYWIEKMLEFGYDYNQTIVTMMRLELKPWRHRKELYHNNLMYFQRRK